MAGFGGRRAHAAPDLGRLYDSAAPSLGLRVSAPFAKPFARTPSTTPGPALASSTFDATWHPGFQPTVTDQCVQEKVRLEMQEPTRRFKTANTALRAAVAAWFVTASIGLWIFLLYVVAVFGSSAVQRNFESWNENLTSGYVPGDSMGNVAVATHLFLAIIVLGGGPLQLMPGIRNRYPAFHRWLGRTYMLAVVTITLTGLYMWLSRDIGSVTLKDGFIVQASLIVGFSAIALRYAIVRDIHRHRRWALRFFMVASIALSYRVIFMVWVLVTGGVGIDFATGKGAFLDFMAVGQYLPLLVLEIYLRTQDRGSALSRFAMAGFLLFATGVTGLGVSLLTVWLWFPQT